jgi:phage-related protein
MKRGGENMADGEVKIIIDGDDSGLQETLDETEESLKGLGDGQKETQKETEKTTSKFKELAETIDKQSEELQNLKGDYTEAIINFGKGSAEAKALEDKMSSLNSELSKNKETFAKASNEAKGLTSALDENVDSFGTADVAIGSFIGNALTNLTSKIGETIGNIIALADETREYREDMAKLDSAFTTAGHSTETAQKAYDGFYKILGESDRTVEAVNHLAEMTKNEEELAQWSTICAGVTARFGDSLPIEGLTEAANETAKVGAVTGPLADALNWAGISEDEFNKKLAACNSEQERASLITSTLNGEYAAAAEEYNKLTANTQAARDATNNMEQAQAALGAAIEPVTTAWTNMKANALQWFVDVGLPALQNGWQWVKDNLPAIGIIVGGFATAWLVAGGAMTVAATATKIMTAVQTALNASMFASPITWIILGITALVAAFVILWNNCEGFREFWINLWEKIKSAAGAIAEWFKNAWSSTIEWLKGAVATIKDFFADAWEKIKEVFSNSIIGKYFSAIWDTIKGIFAVVKNVLSGNWSEAWNAIKGIVNTWAGFFSGIWEKIKAVFAVIGTWFSSKFTEAKDNIVNAFSNIKEKFGEIWEKIKSAFNFKDMLNIGKNLLMGLWNGINDKVAWLKGKVKGVVDKIKGWFTGKDGFDEHSPSKWSKQVAVDVNRGTAIGFENSTDIPVKAAQATTDRIKAAVSLEQARMTQGVGVRDTGFTEVAQAVGMQTAGINSLASEYRRGSNTQVTVPLVLDGRELGRAIVDLGNAETVRTGTSLSFA